jgi:chemotaxis protein CheC
MSIMIEFDEDERDCLQELMNIAYGSGTAAISEILDAFATLNIPHIQIIPAHGLKGYLQGKLSVDDEQYIATQLLNGDISGENLLIINTKSAYNLAKEFDLEDDEIDDNELCDIVLEITNILSSSTIGRLAEELDTAISFEPPSIQKLESIDKFNNDFLKDYQQIIIISTVLAFDDQNINAELLLLTKDESILWLKEALNKILDEL